VHPMQAKKQLARRIVADFHAAEAGTKAGEDWAKQFQKDEVPEEVETVDISVRDISLSSVMPTDSGGGAVRLIGSINTDNAGAVDSFPYALRIDKLLRQAGLAASNTEAAAKIKQGAVSIDGQAVGPREIVVLARIGTVFTLRVGRQMRWVRLTK